MWFRRSLVGWNSLEEFKSTGYSHPIKVRVPGIVYTEVLFQEFFRCLYNVFLCDPVDLKKLVVRAGLSEPVLHADAFYDTFAHACADFGDCDVDSVAVGDDCDVFAITEQVGLADREAPRPRRRRA